MFKNLGQLKYLTEEKEIRISLKDLKYGTNFLDNFIIFQNKDNINIYSRRCDHAGGKIISKDGSAICPIHMWKFDPSTGFYNNGIKKKAVEYSVDRNFIKINNTSYVPQIDGEKKN